MIHSGLNPSPLRGRATNQSPRTARPPQRGSWRSGAQLCPGKAHSLHGTPSRVSAWKEARGGTLHLPTQTLLTSMGAEPSPALQSPELLGPRPLGQQSAACPCASPNMASSSSSSTSSGTFALGPWGRITSQGICGWPGQRLSANVSTPPRPSTVGTHLPGPGFLGVRCAQSRRAWHRSFILLLWHTHGFSVLFSGKTVLFQGAR